METIRIFPIGDTHLCTKEIDISTSLVKRLIRCAKSAEPNLIVHLGDVFDSFGTVQIDVHTLGINMFIELSKIAPVLLLIGNHDRKKSTREFLSDKHFFNALNSVDNIYIADINAVPIYFDDNANVTHTVTSRRIVGVPYVEPGKLADVLSTLEISIENDKPLCVFAHQELHGCIYGGKSSTKGDVWSHDMPLIVCGHIHERQYIEPNILYVGSSRQVATDEKPDKGITILDFDYDINDVIIHEPVMLNIGLKRKDIINIESIASYVPSPKYRTTLHIYGRLSQFKSSEYLSDMKRLYDMNVTVVPHYIHEDTSETSEILDSQLADDTSSLTSYNVLLSLLEDSSDDTYGSDAKHRRDVKDSTLVTSDNDAVSTLKKIMSDINVMI